MVMNSTVWTAQVSTASFSTRHDYVFGELRDCLERHGFVQPRVLSFGCARGHEPLDLKRIIPGAKVLGCDVNQSALAEADNRCRSEDITIFASSPAALSEQGPYHAVVAMNVLTRYPEI